MSPGGIRIQDPDHGIDIRILITDPLDHSAIIPLHEFKIEIHFKN